MKYSDISDLSSVTRLALSVNGKGSCGAYNLTVYAKQNDKSSRYLEVEIISDGKVLTVPDTAIARIRCTKPDGTSVLNDGCVYNGKVYVELSAQILSSPGVVRADIGIYNGEAVLSTALFDIEVTEALFNEAKIASEDEFSSLTEALNTVGNIYAVQAELTDVRKSADGKTYKSAGEAVRAQINGVNSLIYNGRDEANITPDISCRFTGGIEKLSTMFDLPGNSWVSSTGKNFKGDEINLLGDNFTWQLGENRAYRLSRYDWGGEESSVFILESVSAADSYQAYYSPSQGGYLWKNTTPERLADEIISEQTESINQRIDSLTAAQTDIFSIPVKWRFSGYRFISSAFEIPESGFSVRTPSIETEIKGETAAMCFRVDIGTLEDGTFVKDEALTEQYCFADYSRKMFYIPPLEGKYAVVYYTAIGDTDSLLDDANHEEYTHLLDNLKLYSGSVHGGGSLPGVRPVNLRTNSTAEKYAFDWGVTGLIHKYQTLASPLPLKYVKAISCTPDMWLGGKVYRFDPVTRTTEFVETLCFGEFQPVWGYECSLDFSKYDDNCFALLIFGRMPQKSDYESEPVEGRTYKGTKNATIIGFDMTELEKKIHVEWVKKMQIFHEIQGSSPVVQRNISLLRSLRNKTVSGMYPRGTTEHHYIFGVENFSGVLYGGSYQTGTFFYNVSPAAYYTALLNPNSNAYKNEDLGSGIYGIVCAPFASLLHGHSVPHSTFDMRYNKRMQGFTPEKFDFEKQLHTVRRYDVLTLGDGHTGHCVTVGYVLNVNDEYGAMRVLESTHPATGDNLFWLHNSLPYYKDNPEEWYQANYSFICRTDSTFDTALYDKANWVPKYTTPQKVMCNRGYGSVYLTSTPVYISAATDVTAIDVYINGVLEASRNIADMEYEERWGYNLVDISALVGEGEITVKNDADSSEETFYVFNPAGYSVSATLEGDWLTVHTNRPEEVKYINVLVAADPDTYTAEDAASMNYAPEFDENGDMLINTCHVTDEIGTWSLAACPDLLTGVRIVFRTPYDTNTFCVDAAGNTEI